MTVATLESRVQYTGNAVTMSFGFPDVFIDAADIVVDLRDAAGAVVSSVLNGSNPYDYTLAGTLDPASGEYLAGGSVVFNQAPPAAWTITLFRDPAPTQSLVLGRGKFPAEPVNTEFDKVTLLTQALRDRADRSLTGPLSDPIGLAMGLPNVAGRQGAIMGFDNLGRPLAGGNFALLIALLAGGWTPSLSQISWIATIATLRALTPPASSALVALAGYNVAGDKAPVLYLYSLTDTRADDGGLVIKPTGVAGGSPGRWLLSTQGRPFNILDWGADPTGAVESQPAIHNADLAAASSGHSLFLPGGTYKITSPLAPAASACWVGEGRERTILNSNSATATLLNIVNPHFSMSDVGLHSGVARTSGYHIHLGAGGSYCDLTRITVNNPFTALHLGAGTGIVFVDDLEINDAVATADVIVVDGGVALTIRGVVAASSHAVHANVLLNNLGDLTLAECEFLLADYNIYINPNAGQEVTALKCTDVFCDSAVIDNLRAVPVGGGKFQHANFDGCWFGTAGGNNILLLPDGSSTLSGITFSDCDAVNCQTGTNVAILGANSIMWNSGKIAAGPHFGVLVNNAVRVLFNGAIIGPTGTFPGHSDGGVEVSGTSDYVQVIACHNLDGNPQTIVDASSGTHNRYTDNPGYNPLGAVAVTITASPMTYTAGRTPETLYGRGGTLTSVTQGAQQIVGAAAASWSCGLGPNESVVITYSVSPTALAAMRH